MGWSIFTGGQPVSENREKDSSRSDKEHHIKKWDIYPDVRLVVYRRVCPKM